MTVPEALPLYLIEQASLLWCEGKCTVLDKMALWFPFPEDIFMVIADNVGDNIGDIVGLGSDLFGSYAEWSCAALVVASISSFGINHELTAMLYPLLVSSVGIVMCLITTLFATK